MKKIFISDYLRELSIEDDILNNYTLVQNKKDLKECVGALLWHEKFPDNFINSNKLKAVSRYGAGIDNIDLSFCKRNKIRVCNTADYGVDEVSNTALAFLLWCARGIGNYSDLALTLNDGSWESNINTSLRRIKTQTLGIIGLGRIGSSLAIKANFLGFNVMGFDPNQIAGHEKIINIKRVKNLNELLLDSDYISLNCDLNKSSFELVNDEFLNKLKPSASIINTARGSIIKSVDSILDRILDGKLANFATDVLPEEPICEKLQSKIKSNKKLLQNVLITPHVAFYSSDSFKEMRIKAATNLKNMLVSDYLSFEEKNLFRNLY